MLIAEGLTVYGIATELNRSGVPCTHSSKWDYRSVYGILTHPKYAGCHVYGRTSCRLYTRTVKLPKSDWILTHGAFEPVVDESTFLAAQQILAGRTFNKSNEELLASLKGLLAEEGRLSLTLVKESPNVPSPSTYRLRFGSLRKAYELIGYGRPEQFGPIDLRRRTQALREEVMAKIATMFPHDVSIVRRGGRWRSRLRLRGGLIVSVLVARSVRAWKNTFCWQIDPVRHERKNVALLARLDKENQTFLDFHVLPNIDRPRRFHIRDCDPWLNRGLHLNDLSSLCTLVRQVRSAKRDDACA